MLNMVVCLEELATNPREDFTITEKAQTSALFYFKILGT